MQQLSARYFFTTFLKNEVTHIETAQDELSLQLRTKAPNLHVRLCHWAQESEVSPFVTMPWDTRPGEGPRGIFVRQCCTFCSIPAAGPVSPQTSVHGMDKGPACFSQNCVTLADHQGTAGFSNTLRGAQELSQVCTIHTKQ